ncbi:MAG: hypothetical protein MJ072_06570 [Clostridia bacterium]|nr:hypothetical protein [Clostridia bacterium]
MITLGKRAGAFMYSENEFVTGVSTKFTFKTGDWTTEYDDPGAFALNEEGTDTVVSWTYNNNAFSTYNVMIRKDDGTNVETADITESVKATNSLHIPTTDFQTKRYQIAVTICVNKIKVKYSSSFFKVVMKTDGGEPEFVGANVEKSMPIGATVSFKIFLAYKTDIRYVDSVKIGDAVITPQDGVYTYTAGVGDEIIVTLRKNALQGEKMLNLYNSQDLWAGKVIQTDPEPQEDPEPTPTPTPTGNGCSCGSFVTGDFAFISVVTIVLMTAAVSFKALKRKDRS